MEAEQLVKGYSLGKRNFTWADLQGAILNQANLSGINLYRAKLNLAKLEAVDFSQANLMHVDFSDASLVNANLTGATLIKSNLTGAELVNADLSHANLKQAKLNRANLSGAVLLGANIEMVDLTETNLTGATMPDGSSYAEWQIAIANQTVDTTTEDEPEEPLPANPPNLPVAVVPQVKKRLTKEEFWHHIPLPTLALLWISYFLLGRVLAGLQAPLILYLLAWFSSVTWALNESLTFLTSLSVGVVVFIAIIFQEPTIIYNFYLLFLVVIIIATLFAFWVSGFNLKTSLVASLSLGGLVAGFFGLCILFFVSLNTWTLAFQVMIGVFGAALGSVAWLQMDQAGYTKQENLQIFGGGTGIALLTGWILGSLLHQG